MTYNKSQKNPIEYYCEICNYNTFNKKDYNKHLSTDKHKYLQNTSENPQKSHIYFSCDCGKKYKHRQSLYNHKKSCKILNNENMIINTENKEDMKDLVMKLIDENKELRKTITEIVPKIGNNNNNIKQKFNINLFLNEKCKDALSMDQFIDQIEVSIKNILTTHDKGQAQGVTDIIMDNMNRLSIYERPLHCTDKKRETLYIKTDEWECDKNKNKINEAIKKIEVKQFKNIKNWVDEHPNYMTNEREQDEFLKIVKETSNSIEENREKVIKNICEGLHIEDSTD